MLLLGAASQSPDQFHQLLDQAKNAVVPAISSLVGLFAGRWWGRYQARKRWRRHESFDRLNISVNVLADDRLRIRTVLERPLEEIVPNLHARDQLLEASKVPKPWSPLIYLDKAEDMRFVLNCILNATAEHFSAGEIRRHGGQDVACVSYEIFLTCELAEAAFERKIRAMLMKTEDLENFPFVDKMPELERKTHNVRVDTLRRAAEIYKERPEMFARIELCV